MDREKAMGECLESQGAPLEPPETGESDCNGLVWGESSEIALLRHERRRIAGELHDNVAQRLLGVAWLAGTLRQDWDGLPPREVDGRLQRLEDSLREVYQELRHTVFGIREQVADETRFVREIRDVLQELGHAYRVPVEIDVQLKRQLDPELRYLLLRVVVEASSNALKHSNCRSLRVSLVSSDSGVALEVRDDGDGIPDQDRANPRGYGLYNMEELVKAHSGKIQILSVPERGTSVVVVVPPRKNSSEVIPTGGARNEVGHY